MPVLVTWLVIDRVTPDRWKAARWVVPLVVFVLLTWTMIADSIVLITCIAPLVLVVLIRSCPGLIRRGERPASRWYELSLAGAAAVAGGLGSAAPADHLRPGRIPAGAGRVGHDRRRAAASVLGNAAGRARALRSQRVQRPARDRSRLRLAAPGRRDPGHLRPGSRAGPALPLPGPGDIGVRGGHRVQPGRLHVQRACAGHPGRTRDRRRAPARRGAGRRLLAEPLLAAAQTARRAKRWLLARARGDRRRLPGHARLRRGAAARTARQPAAGQLAGRARAHRRAGRATGRPTAPRWPAAAGSRSAG